MLWISSTTTETSGLAMYGVSRRVFDGIQAVIELNLEVARDGLSEAAEMTSGAFSVGDATPIYVPPRRLRAELARRGFADFAEFSSGRSTAFVARKR